MRVINWRDNSHCVYENDIEKHNAMQGFSSENQGITCTLLCIYIFVESSWNKSSVVKVKAVISGLTVLMVSDNFFLLKIRRKKNSFLDLDVYLPILIILVCF